MSDPLPLVSVFSLGGTIASPAGSSGAVPLLGASDLVASVPALERVARIATINFRQVASPELRLRDLVELTVEASRHVAAGAKGIVITQGTDTLEETAFALDLLWDQDSPIVVTGAMRNPSLPGADGHANLLASVQVAASDVTRRLGSLVVFNDEIHSGRFVQKTHTSSLATFRSSMSGQLGWVSEGAVRIATRPTERHLIQLRPPLPEVEIGIYRATQGDRGRYLGLAAQAGFNGLVIEALGGGHLPAGLVAIAESLSAKMPVVLASRTGSGEVLRSTYGFPGSERDLIARGLKPAGYLDGLKARMLLLLLLSARAGPTEIEAAFELVGAPGQGAFHLAALDAKE